MKKFSPLLCAVLVSLLAAAATLWCLQWGELSYSAKLIRSWELWRLFTPHLLHVSWLHWAVSSAVLFVAALAAYHQGERYFCGALFFTALTVGAGFAWLLPASASLSGLSGVAWGGAAFVASAEVSREGPSTKLAIFFLMLILFRPAVELFFGIIVLAGVPDEPKFHALAAAHMMGAVAGAVAGYWAGKRPGNAGKMDGHH